MLRVKLVSALSILRRLISNQIVRVWYIYVNMPFPLLNPLWIPSLNVVPTSYYTLYILHFPSFHP